MGHPPKQLIIGIPTASFDGKFYGRYPLGNKPQGAALAGQAAAQITAVAALNTTIKLVSAAVAGATVVGALVGPPSGFTWYALPAPGAIDSNSWIDGQTFPSGSFIRIVTGPAHVTLNLSNRLWANDANDWCTAANGYTGSDSATFEIWSPSGTTSQFTSTITVS
jgi:UDP-N-acetylmuramyl tripeptide synthase